MVMFLTVGSLVLSVPSAQASGNAFIDGINSARAGQGKAQLVVNGDLQRVAQDKANRMAAANTLSGDAYAASWKGGAQAVAADPAGRVDVLLRNEFLSKQAGATLNGNYGIIGVGEAVSSNGTLFVAVNVAPKPYVPAPQPAPAPAAGGAQPATGGGSSTAQNPSASVDNSAAIAEAEKRAVERAQAEAKAVEEKRIEAEKKKQAEERKAQEEAAAKKAEEEAEAKRLEQEAQETRDAEIAAQIKQAEDKAAEEAEAKRLAEERAEEQAQKEQALRDRISSIAMVSVAGLLILSVLTLVASVVMIARNRPLSAMSVEEFKASKKEAEDLTDVTEPGASPKKGLSGGGNGT